MVSKQQDARASSPRDNQLHIYKKLCSRRVFCMQIIAPSAESRRGISYAVYLRLREIAAAPAPSALSASRASVGSAVVGDAAAFTGNM